MIEEKIDEPRALLIGLDHDTADSIWTIEDSLIELSELARTAGILTTFSLSQKRNSPHPSTYVGKGKLEEIKTLVEENNLNILIADDELKPFQQKALEKELKIKIMDRTSLILDIFSLNAHTQEAQLQVELAQLNYLLPRLTRMWTHLSRLGGGIGTRGPGEKQLESDKRQINTRITLLKKKLLKVQQHRQLRREKRENKPVSTAVLVGYTNAGKSTLMNRITEANVLSENKLFATLDPTTRKVSLDSNSELVITDTVGFIQKLPHHLVKAFYATLEEVTQADILLHVVDASHPHFEGMIQTSQQTINALEAQDKPQLFVFNKWDLVNKPNAVKQRLLEFQPHLLISAKEDLEFEALFTQIDTLLLPQHQVFSFHIPYHRMDIVNLLHENGDILKKDFLEKEIEIEVKMNKIVGSKIMSELGKAGRLNALR